MTKNLHRMNLPLVFTRIILCCSCFLLINCSNETSFERNIDLITEWQQNNDICDNKNTTKFTSEFNLNIEKDKVYLLELVPPKNVHEVVVNKNIILGNFENNKKISFNISKQLKAKNTIEIKGKNASHFEAKIHCVNKLFIPDVYLETIGRMALAEVKVKNAFNTEKQGILKYTLYSEKNKKLQTKETPIFIAGNAENSYRQELNIDARHTDLKGLKVVCSLYSGGKLFDKNEDVLLKIQLLK